MPGTMYPGQPSSQYPSEGMPGSTPGMGYYPPSPYQSYQYGSADQSYQEAMQAYRQKAYRAALWKFREVATYYPQSDLADNAYYWMGEVYYGLKHYPTAIQSFQQVMYRYPRGNKVPDAMLKMGYAYAEMRQYQIARSVLNAVIARYSDNTRINKLAVKKLNAIQNRY